ncbi:hypothetical protein ABZ682_22785 [Streptomyces griseoviridis]|uniref:hypothetical protein n=1 Tax=Streptomyces griseoviridis TaxID=45398 RepID=UPI0033F84F85
MAQRTDLCVGSPQGIPDEQRFTAAEALAQAAGVLAANDPNGPIRTLDFTALLGAKVHEVAARNGVRGGVEVLHLATGVVGSVPTDVTRVTLAVQVAKAARVLGYDWSTDDNRRVAELAVGQ